VDGYPGIFAGDGERVYGLIEEQKILDYMRESAYRPLKREELEAAFAVAQEDLDAFYALLNRMEDESVNVRTRTQYYG